MSTLSENLVYLLEYTNKDECSHCGVYHKGIAAVFSSQAAAEKYKSAEEKRTKEENDHVDFYILRFAVQS
jgi:rRNA maturation protein Nop10